MIGEIAFTAFAAHDLPDGVEPPLDSTRPTTRTTSPSRTARTVRGRGGHRDWPGSHPLVRRGGRRGGGGEPADRRGPGARRARPGHRGGRCSRPIRWTICGPIRWERRSASKRAAKFSSSLARPDKTGLHYRHGKHDQNVEDFTGAARLRRLATDGEDRRRTFDTLPFANLPPTYKWKAPGAQYANS